MARILRGDIWWADLDPVRGREQAGRRPVLGDQSGRFRRAVRDRDCPGADQPTANGGIPADLPLAFGWIAQAIVG